MRTDLGEREFRVRPPRPRRIRTDEARAWSVAFGRIMHFARMTSRRSRLRSGRRHRRFSQRCAVRVTYATNRTRGHWAAHGRYLAREGASDQPGFGPGEARPDIPSVLDAWQRAGDPRLFKLIVSPEFGDRLDLEALTRRMMTRMERDLGTGLEWVAIVHRNTEHPHVHVTLRGLTEERTPLRLERDYIRHGIRQIAEDLATAQLGYRREADALEARRREVRQLRFTSLDRLLRRSGTAASPTTGDLIFRVDLSMVSPSVRTHLGSRLIVLQRMGLAEPAGRDRWLIRSDFETVLRAMQQSSDRLRVLAAHGAVLSDPRLPVTVTDPGDIRSLSGRVLGHGEDEASSRTYMMVEGTDHKVHFIWHTPRMRSARRDGKLRANAFVRLHARSVRGRPVLQVDDLGDSETILLNAPHMRQTAIAALKRGPVPDSSGWGGWLGRYDAALGEVAALMSRERRGGRGR